MVTSVWHPMFLSFLSLFVKTSYFVVVIEPRTSFASESTGYLYNPYHACDSVPNLNVSGEDFDVVRAIHTVPSFYALCSPSQRAVGTHKLVQLELRLSRPVKRSLSNSRYCSIDDFAHS